MPVQFAAPWQAPAIGALFVIWAALLFGGFAIGPTAPDRTRRMPTWTRLASSGTLVVIAWLWYALIHESAAADYAIFIAIGMSCGFLGDLILAGVTPLGSPVLGGIAAFGLGHVAYLLGILRMSSYFHLDALAPRLVLLALWLIIGLAGWYALVYRGQKATGLHWAALPYALLLASVAGLFTGLAAQSPAFIPAALGAALFLLSDLILASQLFTGRSFPFIGDVVWLTYGPGQALIVGSIASALIVAGGR